VTRFLLAQLHLESLAKKHTRRSVRATLETLPQKLDDTYSDALERIYSHQDPEDTRLAMRILTWITFASRPLSVRELQHGLAVMDLDNSQAPIVDEDSLPQPELLVVVCSGIVAVDKESNIVRLVHYTTQEYFDRVRSEKFPDGQRHMMVSCLRYLQLPNFADGPAPTDEAMAGCLADNALLSYASQYWGHHARGLLESEHQGEILGFLDNRVAFLVAIQAHRTPNHRYNGWSRMYDSELPPLVHAVSFGLLCTTKSLLDRGTDVNIHSSSGETALITAATGGHAAIVKLLLTHNADTTAVNSLGQTALVCAATHGHAPISDILLPCLGVDVDQKAMALRVASQHGHISIVVRILKQGVDVDSRQNGDGPTALILASEESHANVVSHLLLAGADPDIMDSRTGRTPLMIAADQSNAVVARCLVEGGADINAKDQLGGRNAISRAARNGDHSFVRLMLNAGADIHSKDTSGWTCFMNAVDNGHEETVSLLLHNGADANDTSDWTALMRAAGKGFLGIVQQLLDIDADLESRDTGERTALMHAVTNGEADIVRMLLNAGADVRVRLSDGTTVFDAAAPFPGVVAMLREAAARTSPSPTTRDTALFEAAACGKCSEVERVVFPGSPKLAATDEFGWTLLMRAADRGHNAVVQLLLRAGADCDVKSSSGWTALIRVAIKGYEDVLETLLAAGPDIESSSATGWTALIHASHEGHLPIVKRLLDAGASPSTKDVSLWTPLMRSADNGHAGIVSLLIRAGAELDVADKSGWTALCRAVDKCHTEVVHDLCLAGANPSSGDLSGWSPLMRAACKGSVQNVRVLLLAGADITIKDMHSWTVLVKRHTPNPQPILRELTGAWERIVQKRGISVGAMAME
jgi:ankyrin repeat protein